MQHQHHTFLSPRIHPTLHHCDLNLRNQVSITTVPMPESTTVLPRRLLVPPPSNHPRRWGALVHLPGPRTQPTPGTTLSLRHLSHSPSPQPPLHRRHPPSISCLDVTPIPLSNILPHRTLYPSLSSWRKYSWRLTNFCEVFSFFTGFFIRLRRFMISHLPRWLPSTSALPPTPIPILFPLSRPIFIPFPNTSSSSPPPYFINPSHCRHFHLQDSTLHHHFCYLYSLPPAFMDLLIGCSSYHPISISYQDQDQDSSFPCFYPCPSLTFSL